MLQGLFDVASLSLFLSASSFEHECSILHGPYAASALQSRFRALQRERGRGVRLVLSDPNAQGRCSPVVFRIEQVEKGTSLFYVLRVQWERRDTVRWEKKAKHKIRVQCSTSAGEISQPGSMIFQREVFIITHE